MRGTTWRYARLSVFVWGVGLVAACAADPSTTVVIIQAPPSEAGALPPVDSDAEDTATPVVDASSVQDATADAGDAGQRCRRAVQYDTACRSADGGFGYDFPFAYVCTEYETDQVRPVPAEGCKLKAQTVYWCCPSVI